MPSKTINVFVSYSHADASLVAPVVRLLRVNEALVFQDTDGILPGKRWRNETAQALAGADLVVVFWCCHAFRSNEVSNEWRAAIEQEKDLLPLLLDATPLPSELSDFQWIDFRATVGANHGAVDSLATQLGRALSPMHKLPGLMAAILVAILVAIVVNRLLILSDILPRPYPTLSDGPTPLSNVVVITSILGIVGALASVVWLRHRYMTWHQRFQRTTTVKPQLEAIERRIAAELGTEILRRTGSAQDAGA